VNDDTNFTAEVTLRIVGGGRPTNDEIAAVTVALLGTLRARRRHSATPAAHRSRWQRSTSWYG